MDCIIWKYFICVYTLYNTVYFLIKMYMFLSVSYSAVSILYDRSVCKLYLGILGVDGKQGLHFQHKLL